MACATFHCALHAPFRKMQFTGNESPAYQYARRVQTRQARRACRARPRGT
ncbi:hypothetical protein BIFGAL_04205 [Bifidobacterium gallicum DSM 20093 = LMG 11596]|uniref:Uncharacterized protein n=1 Tax=Bifidobacterium gallicum DSM 20093 = LMG 11596 TaxID=561180 RepID=D1NWF5_9BIFI|nr:hypothetical protein BIFGAL_04205 [Bifidobacterium gallicum DSM 20093 = LMG 11596]